MKIRSAKQQLTSTSGAESTSATGPASRRRRSLSADRPQLFDALPSTRNSSKSLRRTVSLPATQPETAAPPLHDMIGADRASELDARFGSLQPPRNLAIDGIKPWERTDGSATGQPLMHPNRMFSPDTTGSPVQLNAAPPNNVVDLEALKRGEKKYMWTVSALGRLIIGEELHAGEDLVSGHQVTLGHPTLVGGGAARISGELRYDAEIGKFIVSNRSGRYSRYEDRTIRALDEVVAMFVEMGIDAQRESIDKYITRKRPEKLVLPSLDPARSAKRLKKD
jgi:hypothetical protein